MFFAPLAMFDYDTALYLWISVGVFGFVAVMQMLIKNWLVTIIACGSPLFLWGLATGQTGLISAAILVAGYLVRERGNPFLAGLVFGCLIFKPHMALALPFCFIATRDWKVILGGIASAISIIIMSYCIFGAEAWVEFFASFSDNSSYNLMVKSQLYERIPSIFVTALGFFHTLTLAISMHVIGSLLAIAVCIHIWRTSNDHFAKLTCLFITPALISPYFFDYDLASVGILFGLLLLETIRKKQLDWHFIALLGIWLMGISIFTTRLNGLSLGPVFLIGLMIYAILRTREENHEK